LPEGAVAVVPAAARELDPHLRHDLRYVRVGDDARLVSFEPPVLAADVRGARVEVEVPFVARHQAENAMTALAAYAALGLPLAGAGRGAGQIAFSRWRGEELPLPGGGLLINDAWNANPVSMRAALDHLAARANGRRTIAVLGDMAELGADGPRYHREAGEAASRAGVAILVAVGPLARGYVEGMTGGAETYWAETLPEAIETLRSLLRDGDCVLVKGSRALGLERVAGALGADEKVREESASEWRKQRR
jgi:UDP-N-acetylmuramoyl-tripeptide--D-alanyl-D-alanine ligase